MTIPTDNAPPAAKPLRVISVNATGKIIGWRNAPPAPAVAPAPLPSTPGRGEYRITVRDRKGDGKAGALTVARCASIHWAFQTAIALNTTRQEDRPVRVVGPDPRTGEERSWVIVTALMEREPDEGQVDRFGIDVVG